jgi:hypothetical protein
MSQTNSISSGARSAETSKLKLMSLAFKRCRSTPNRVAEFREIVTEMEFVGPNVFVMLICPVSR